MSREKPCKAHNKRNAEQHTEKEDENELGIEIKGTFRPIRNIKTKHVYNKLVERRMKSLSPDSIRTNHAITTINTSCQQRREAFGGE